MGGMDIWNEVVAQPEQDNIEKTGKRMLKHFKRATSVVVVVGAVRNEK